MRTFFPWKQHKKDSQYCVTVSFINTYFPENPINEQDLSWPKNILDVYLKRIIFDITKNLSFY